MEVLWFAFKVHAIFIFFFLFLQNHLKDILTSVVSKKRLRLRDGHFKYAFGSQCDPTALLKNSVVAYNSLIEGI